MVLSRLGSITTLILIINNNTIILQSTKLKTNYVEISRREKNLLFFLQALALADVVIRAQDGDVGPIPHGSLEEIRYRPLPSRNVLLIIRHIISQPTPSILVCLFRLVKVSSHDLEGASGDPPMADTCTHLLQPAPQEC